MMRARRGMAALWCGANGSRADGIRCCLTAWCWQALATGCHASLLRSLLRIADHTARLDLAGDSRHGGQREAEVRARSPSATAEFAT